MNKRVANAAHVLRGYAINDETSEDALVLSRKRYQEMAATAIVVSDDILFSDENVRAAFVKSGLPAELFEPCVKFAEALRDSAPEVFTVDDMHKAWNEAHEDGFWDGRGHGSEASIPVFEGELPFPFKLNYTENDIEIARTAGYASGFANGAESSGLIPPDSTLLVGGEHADANNPYPLPENDAEGHTLWCKGGHKGPCKRGIATGTEKELSRE